MAFVKGSLYVISAPSGAGKTSLVTALVKQVPDLVVSVSHTTRPPRPGEREGVHYFFLSSEAFAEKIREGDFLEHATVFGRSYGTSREWVLSQLNQGRDVILEIDWQGGEQIKALLPETIGIFIFPPSLESLKNRLHARGQDEALVIAQRLAEAQEEMSHYQAYDYLIVNDDFEQALAELKAIMVSQRLTLGQQVKRQEVILAQLRA